MDLDYLNANARSMISLVVYSNQGRIFSGLMTKAQGHVVAGEKTPLYESKSNLLYT
ncbi:hypothetical protein ACNKHP_21125 [Shigella boydii]